MDSPENNAVLLECMGNLVANEMFSDGFLENVSEKIYNDIMDVWLFDYDGEVDLNNATTDEVAQVAWMDREQIKELFEQKMFVETLEYFFTEVDKERS